MLLEHNWEPWEDIRRLRQDMHRIFDRSATRHWNLAGHEARPINVTRGEDKAIIEVLAPGLDRESLDVTVLGDTVTVKGERKSPEGLEPTRCHRHERQARGFSRTVRLGQALAAGQAQATYRDGIVSIEVPWAPETKPRKIDVAA